MKDPKENRKLLYDTLQGQYSDLGTFDEFNAKLDIPEKRNLLYNTIKNDFTDIGTYNEFNQKLGILNPSSKPIPKIANESDKSWWDTFLDNFRPAGMSSSNIFQTLNKNPGQSYVDLAIQNTGGSNPAVSNLTGQAIGKSDIKEVSKWRMDQYKSTPYTAAVAEGFGRGMLNFIDNATGGWNEKFLQAVDTKGQETMQKQLSPEEYKKYKENYDNTKLVQDISAGIASSVGFLVLSNGFAGTSLGMKAAGMIEKGEEAMKGAGILSKLAGFGTKVLGGGLGSLQALGTGAVIKSIRDSASGESPNLLGNLGENLINAAMEGMSEELLKEYEFTGGNRLFGAVKKSLSTFMTEAITENVSDMTNDFFSYLRERNDPAQSIIGDIIKNGKIGKDTFYNFMVEGLSGAIMGAAFGGFSNSHIKDGEKIDNAIKDWVKAEPEKAKAFFDNVMKSVQDKSISPTLLKAMGLSGEYNRLISYARDNFDESKLDTDEKKAIHVQAKQVSDEAMQRELLPNMNKIIMTDGNANVLDTILMAGKSKKDGYQLGVENQLSTSFGFKPALINLDNVHEFTSKILAELKTSQDVMAVHDKFSRQFSLSMADDLLIGSFFPQLIPITSTKISSSAIDEQEHMKAMQALQTQIETLKSDPKLSKSLQSVLQASVLKASEVMAKSVKNPIKVTEDPEMELKPKKEKTDDFLDIFGPDKTQEELDNLRAQEMMNSDILGQEKPVAKPLNRLIKQPLTEGKASPLVEVEAEAPIVEEIPVPLSRVMPKTDAEILQEGIKNGTIKEAVPQIEEPGKDYLKMSIKELKREAKGKLRGYSSMNKTELIDALNEYEGKTEESLKVFRDETTGESYVTAPKNIFEDVGNEADADLLPDISSSNEVLKIGVDNPDLEGIPKTATLDVFLKAFTEKHGMSSDSLGKLLSAIAKELGGKLNVRVLYDEKEIVKMLSSRDEKGNLKSNLPALGAYSKETIYINGRASDQGHKNVKKLRRTILHEALHALTVDMLDANHESYNDGFKKEINRILDEARKNIDPSKILNEYDREAVSYALKNDKEFIAGIYSATSHALIGLLDKVQTKTMQTARKETLWNRVTESIKNALKFIYSEAVKKTGEKGDAESLLDQLDRTMDNYFRVLHAEAVISDKIPKALQSPELSETVPVSLAGVFRKKESVLPEPVKIPVEVKPKLDDFANIRPEEIASTTQVTHSNEDDNDTSLPQAVEVKSTFADNPELITLNNIASLAKSLSKFFPGNKIDGKNYNAFINRFDFNQYMQFYDAIVSKADPRAKDARELLEKEFDHKYKHSNMSFEEFTDRRLRSLWNYSKAQSEQYVLDIIYDQNPSGKLFQLVKRLGSYKTADGKTGNTLQAPKLIEQFKGDMEKLLGADLDIYYVNGFSRDDKGELKGFHSSFDVNTSDCANALFNQTDFDGTKAQYIFLNVFGEKSTLPLLKIKSGQHINLDLIDRIIALHAESLGSSYVPETSLAEKVTNASRIMLEELRLGNTVQNIASGLKENSYTYGKDFARLMKRSYLVMDSQHLEQDKHLIDKLQLEDKTNPTEGISVVPDENNPGKKKIMVSSIIMDTEDIPDVQIDLGVKVPDEKGVLQAQKVPLKDLLLNAIGKQTTDGASIYVMGKFDTVYRAAFGLLKGGDIKNFISYNSMYIKHAMHGISSKDALGKWMLANNLAMITFDSAEKNGKKKGEEDRYPLVKASQIGMQLDPGNIIQIPLENFYHIKEGGKSKSEIKGFMQFVNSSGLSPANPILQKIDPSGKLIKAVDGIVNNIATSLNSELKDFMGDEKKIVALLQRMRTDALSNQQKRIVDILGDQFEGTDDEVISKMRKLLDHPTLTPMIISRLNNKLMDAFKYVAPGAMPVLSPDTGYATQTRINKMKGDILWNVLDEPLGSPVITAAMPASISVAGTNIRDAVKMLRDMKIEQQKYKTQLYEDEELTGEDKKNLKDEIDDLDDQQRYLYHQMVTAYNEYVSNQDDPNLKPIIDTKNISFKYFLNDNTPIVRKWIEDKLSQKIDRATGRLKEGYCMISQDIARMHSLKTGDKVLMSITPTDSLMGGNVFEVAAVLGEDISASNKVVLPSEYIQAVGKDYDVDVVSLYPHDRKFYTDEEWKALTDNNTTGKIYQEYVSSMYELITGDKFNLQVPERIKQLPNWKEAFVTDEKVHLQFMQKYLGSAKETNDGEEREVSKSSYGLVGKDALKLGDSFRKEVAPIVTMRTLHTLLTKIGLTSKVASYDINPKQNWLTNHIAHLIATNDRVDFPKRTNQLQYDSNPLKLEAKMYNSQLYKDYETSLAVSLANKYIFQEVIELPRGTDIMFGGGRDLNDTLQYMKTASEKMDMLKEGTDRTSLIKGAKKFATDSLSGNKQVNKALVLKQVEEYIKNIKVENPDGYSAINMARNIDTQLVENARKGVQYDTYRGIEAKVFDSMLAKFKGLLSKSGGYNMFDDQLRNLSKITDKDGNQIYAGLDEADKRVVSLVLALNSLDYKRGTTYDKSNKDKSLYLLREELVQIARPVQEKAGTKASVVTEARSRVFPLLMKLLLNQKAFVFAKGTERGDKVTLKKDGLSVEVYRDQYDQLKVNYETKEKRLQGIDAQNIKNIPELSDLFYGRNNLFNDSKYANENKSSFSSLVPVSSDNISSEDRNTLLKDWLSSRLTDSKGERNYSDSDLKMIFTSLLVPYQNRTLLGRLDEKQSYIKAFTNFRDKLMSETGQEPTKRQIINYNLAIDHFKNDAKVNMEYLKKLFQDAKIPMPMLEISMNRNNLSRPFISQKGGYQSNDLVLELSSRFAPEFTEDYWDHFRQYNTLDTVKMENDKQIALRSDSTDTSVDYLPDFDNTSRSKWFDDAVSRIEERDQSVDKLLSKSKIAQLWEFKKIVKDDPKRAFKYLQAAADNIDILVALSATDHADFTLNDVIKDIRNGSYEKFARIYDSIPSRRASEMYSKLDMNNLENSGKRMAGTLYQMLKAKESFEKKGKMWFRDVSNIHTFAMDYGQKPFNRMSDLDLKVCKLNVSSDPLENMKVQPVLDQEKVFNANTSGWIGDVQVFAYRSKYWTDQVKETMGEMNAYLTAHRSYKNDLADHLKIETPEARAKMNKDVWDFAEREFNKDPKLNGKIEFVNDQGGVKVSYDGSIIDEEVLATRLFGDDPVKRYSFLSALQMRKLYDSDVPKVLTNAKVYFEDVYSKLMKMNSDVSRQNAKYIASIIYRYDEVLKAIHNPYDTETSYMPHMIRDEEQFRTQFKLLHWDSALKQALETRDVERKKVQKGIAGADAMIASMTNQQIEEKLKQKLDEHLDNMKIDNPLIPVNANWKERIMYENDLYTKTDDTPNISYMDNLQRTLSNDLLIADSYLYQARSIASNENPYVMETMRLWYGNQLTNKLLHTKPLAKSKLRPGMEIQFMRQVPMVTVSNGIKSFDFAGKLISSTKNSITVELPNGNTKTHQFDADISATEGYREQMHWGKVANVTKDEISLKNGESTTSYKTKDLYSRDVGYKKDELNLQRYMVRGAVERLNGLMREEGYNEDKKKDFRYYLMKAPATLANFQERWTSMMILGGLSSVRSGLRNLVGGVMELISYGPFRYSRYIAKGREMFRKAATYDPLRQGKEAQSVRQIAQFKQAMVQEGLLPSMVSLSSEFVNAVAFGTTETELSSMAKDLNVDPNSFKDFKTFLKIFVDKTDYREHKAKMDAIREKMMTSDPKKRMVAELDLKKEEVFYKAKVNGIALQTDQMWTNQEIDRLLNTLPEAEDIGSLTNIDKNLAWKMMINIIDHKLSGPFMKLFTLPEAMLRKNSFYVGYYEWLDTHPGDTHGALENAHKRVAIANALYTSAEKQFGNKTALGKLIYKFAQYSMNQYQVYRRMIPEAEQQIIEHGWKSLNPLQTYVKGEEGEKVNVGTENNPVYVLNLGKKLTSTILLNSLMIGSASSGLYGLSSLANPVLSMVVAWIKLLIGSGQDNPDKKKRDQELMQNLSESLPWIGFGLKNPIQAIATGQYGNMDPITSNTNYKIAKSIMEQAVPGGEDPNLIYQLIGFSESTPKKSSK